MSPAEWADDLAQALRQLIDASSLADEMRQRGLERAQAFSWDTTAKTTIEGDRDAAAAGPRR